MSPSLASGIRSGPPVAWIVRSSDDVTVFADAGCAGVFDHVVLATHADTSLRILGETPTRASSNLFAFRYQEIVAVLHRDSSFMPSRRRAWSSWNYLSEEEPRTG